MTRTFCALFPRFIAYTRNSADLWFNSCLLFSTKCQIAAPVFAVTRQTRIGERPLQRYLAYYRRPDLADDQRVSPLLPAGRLLLDFLPVSAAARWRAGAREPSA
nr:hypothetical protein [uncultured Rhodopila sp.]